ncbi:MAG: T9SS type A sorting domain-containing protein, partial [Bacteroidales bacterium]|nr:T9SS type A sorting domain-containing protein [Bacteroidales bacterium]
MIGLIKVLFIGAFLTIFHLSYGAGSVEPPEWLKFYEGNPYGIEFYVEYDYELLSTSEGEYYPFGPLTFHIKCEKWTPIILRRTSWEAYQHNGAFHFTWSKNFSDYTVGEWFEYTFERIYRDTFFLIDFRENFDDGSYTNYHLEGSFINSSDYLSEEDYKLVFPDDVNGLESMGSQGLDIMVNDGQIMVVGTDGIAPMIEIYDANGRLVLKASASSPIDISHLPKGLYIARTQSSS